MGLKYSSADAVAVTRPFSEIAPKRIKSLLNSIGIKDLWIEKIQENSPDPSGMKKEDNDSKLQRRTEDGERLLSFVKSFFKSREEQPEMTLAVTLLKRRAQEIGMQFKGPDPVTPAGLGAWMDAMAEKHLRNAKGQKR